MRISAQQLMGPTNAAGLPTQDDYNWFTQNRISESDPRVIHNPDGSVNIPDAWDQSNFKSSFADDWAPLMMFGGPIAGMAGALGGLGAAGAGAGGAMDMGVGLQGWMDSLGTSAAGGAGAASAGMTWDSTINNFVDQWGNVVDQSAMPGTTPGYTSPTGITPGYNGGEAVQELIKKVGPDAAKSLLSRLADGSATAADYLKIGEQLASTLLGVVGANNQTKALQSLSQQFADYGAPYRARLAESYADPATFLANSPDIKAAVDQGTSATARALSVQGNPAQSGHALQELQNYATTGLYGKLGQERDRLGGFGGLTAYNSAAPAAATNAVTSQAGVPNAIGAGISAITNPVKTTYQTMMDFFNQPGVA